VEIGNELDLTHRHERIGRPLGESFFVEDPEQVLDGSSRPQRSILKILTKSSLESY